MKSFDKALYEGTVLAVGKILAKYNAFAQSVIMKDVGKEIIGYLKRQELWFEEDGSLQDLNRTVDLFLSHGFAEDLKVEPAEKGDYYIWKGLFLLKAYKELQDATGSPFISCPMNLCLSHLCAERGKFFQLHDKTFDMDKGITVSNWELVESNPVIGDDFDPLVIENARLYEIAEERANNLEKAQKELKKYAAELELAKQQAEAQALELKKQAKALEAERRAALKAAESRAQFLSSMSHEIRTPMNGVIAMASLLSSTELSEEQKELVSTINSSGDTLLGIINDILDLSKIEAGKLVLEEETFSTRDLMMEISQVFETQAHFRKLDFCKEISDEMPDWVVGDAKRIKQVLYNLLGNAMKFTPAGSVTLKLHSEELEPKLHEYTIAISDTGIGISAEQLESIFDPFTQQADPKTDKSDGNGTGLGLCITKQLLESMNGSISVKSNPGEGSCFTIKLRLRDGDPRVVQEQADGVRSKTEEIRSDLRVLLAEDNPVNQRITQLILEKTNCSLTIVPNGKEALEVHREDPFDVILMDCKMPVMDGFQTTRELRSWEKREKRLRCPVIAMTAHAMKGDSQRCIESGMDDYLTKPLRPEHLLRAVRRWQNSQ